MTNRYNAITVALDHDIREDDAEHIIDAIRMIRGVLTVTPHTVTAENWVIEQRIRRELGQKLWEIIYPPKKA